jgi:hypothetical protein
MNDSQWESFLRFKTEYKKKCDEWNALAFKYDFVSLQKQASQIDKVPDYPVENPVLYSTDLDKFTRDSNIKLIIIGDNPGKNEQLNINKKYLCGQAGKLAANFFSANPNLKVNWNSNVLILNKTPLHTAKTKELLKMLELAKGEQKSVLQKLITDSQVWCAQNTVKLHKDLNSFSNLPVANCFIWIVGYSELKKNGIFNKYKEEFCQFYKAYENTSLKNSLLVFQHFSMNRFSIDLKLNYNKILSTAENLYQLGFRHRKEILGF